MNDIDYRRDRAVLRLHGKIDEAAAARLIAALRSADDEYFYERMEISVRSGGGMLASLREILREIQRLRSRGVSVDTCVHGLAGSAAAFLAALGDERRADEGSLLHFHHARLGEVSDLTALGATIAGRGLAVWDAEVLHQLAARGLRAAAPRDQDIEAFEGADWQVVAALLGADPPHLGGEPDEALHRRLLACLREAIGKLVADQDHDGLAALYRNLFDRELSITATLARELLLIDAVGDVQSSPSLATAGPCLHVPEWNSLWTDGRVPTAFLCRHTLILGETGSGKTMSGIKPLLNALLAPDLPDGTVGCVLVVDPKRELWDAVADRGARLIDVGGGGGSAVNLMAGEDWDIAEDMAQGRYLEAAERILIRSASLTPQSPANALAGRPSGAHNQYWQSDGARMARTGLGLTLALLDNSKLLFAGADAAPLDGMPRPALRRLQTFGERAGLLMPHPELRAAARRAIDRTYRLETANPTDPIPRKTVFEVWREFRTAVERSDIHDALPALRAALGTWGDNLRETPGPAPLRHCVRATMAVALTRLADHRLLPAPGALALAAEAMTLLFSLLPEQDRSERIYGLEKRGETLARPLAYLEDGLDDEPEAQEDGKVSLRERLRLALDELHKARESLADCRSVYGTDSEPIAAVAAVNALATVCPVAAETLREEVDHWCSIASGSTSNSHYMGVKAFADQAFYEFQAKAPAWTLYCGCEPYWRRLVEGGADVVDFTDAVDRDSGCEVFVIQPRLGAARHGLVAKAIKALYFEAVLNNPRRAAGQRMPLVGYIADEFHRFVTADSTHGEQSFLDTCRSFSTFCVLACQCMASVHHALAEVSGGEGGRKAASHAIDMLLANTGTKAFFRTTDPDTLWRLAAMCSSPPGKVSVVDVRPPSTLRAGECYISLPDGRFERRQIAVGRDRGIGPGPRPCAGGPDSPTDPSPRVVPLHGRGNGPSAPPGLEP